MRSKSDKEAIALQKDSMRCARLKSVELINLADFSIQQLEQLDKASEKIASLDTITHDLLKDMGNLARLPNRLKELKKRHVYFTQLTEILNHWYDHTKNIENKNTWISRFIRVSVLVEKYEQAEGEKSFSVKQPPASIDATSSDDEDAGCPLAPPPSQSHAHAIAQQKSASSAPPGTTTADRGSRNVVCFFTHDPYSTTCVHEFGRRPSPAK